MGDRKPLGWNRRGAATDVVFMLAMLAGNGAVGLAQWIEALSPRMPAAHARRLRSECCGCERQPATVGGSGSLRVRKVRMASGFDPTLAIAWRRSSSVAPSVLVQ